jgi:hypothetical protein
MEKYEEFIMKYKIKSLYFMLFYLVFAFFWILEKKIRNDTLEISFLAAVINGKDETFCRDYAQLNLWAPLEISFTAGSRSKKLIFTQESACLELPIINKQDSLISF